MSQDTFDRDEPRTVPFPLRLPTSLKNAAKRMADLQGISLNRFISLAVTQKIDHDRAHAARHQQEDDPARGE